MNITIHYFLIIFLDMIAIHINQQKPTEHAGNPLDPLGPVLSPGTPWGHHARTVIRSAPMMPAAKPPQMPSRAIGLAKIKLDPYEYYEWGYNWARM